MLYLWPGDVNIISVCLCQFVISCCICHSCDGFYLWGLSGVLPNVEVVEVESGPFRSIVGVVCGVVMVNKSLQDEKMGWCGLFARHSFT